MEINKYMNIYYAAPSWIRNLALSSYGLWQSRTRFSRQFRIWYERLMASQWLSEAEIKNQQMERLTVLLEYAYQHVPYYRRIFDTAGLVPRDIGSIQDLSRLPMLTRDSVASSSDLLCSDNMAEYRPKLVKSSGSTGQKLHFYLPVEIKWAVNTAILWRFYSWAGIKPGDRRATLGARIFSVRPPYWKWNRWENQLLLSSHHLDAKNLREYIDLLHKYRVVFIQGHPSAIAVLAQYIVSEGHTVHMKAIFTTGETVFEEHRAVMMKAFNCDVLDTYGMGESAAAADECPEHAGYHETSEYCIIELEPVGDGLFEIVGTCLLNFAMPFIRYRTRDLVRPMDSSSRCHCGRGLPIKFKRLIGRIDDCLVFDDKTVLPVTVRMFMKPLLLPGENYQVIQLDRHRIHVVLTGKVTMERIGQVRDQLGSFLPQNIKIDVEHVDEVRGTNSKVRNVVSQVHVGTKREVTS
jgi:phenylacetate-CoA ligase